MLETNSMGLKPKRRAVKQTLWRFDEFSLTPVHPLTGDEIRALRQREGASQAVFALHLNVTVGLISNGNAGRNILRALR